MRGGDVSAIEGEKEPNATEVQHNDSVDTDAGRNIKQSIIDFTAVSSKDNVRKVTETGDTVAVSSILEDNKGPVVSIGKGIVIEGGTFVKDSSKTIKDVVTEATLKIGEKISIRRFVRYELGEGLEKRNDNLAEEVAKQMAGK